MPARFDVRPALPAGRPEGDRTPRGAGRARGIRRPRPPDELPTAVDLGCGTGANAVFLAERGFRVTGIDFSPVALRKAGRLAEERGVGERVRFVQGDLTAAAIPGVDGPFDLLVDYGTLDDLRGESRRRMADTVERLSRPGAVFLLWCFYAARGDLTWISFNGPSRLAPAIEPGEEERLFGSVFAIERLPKPEPGSRAACFLMTRRHPQIPGAG
ncbi:MAG: hypothetical protein KatS3mg014_0687 [Actinomycetota bacterium]|nr:MAG: hypothetical protein KatS3mg014_0687 [Actinomycetota bacterium]